MPPGIGDYAEADGRLGYRVNDHPEHYVARRNLLHGTHAESGDDRARSWRSAASMRARG